MQLGFSGGLICGGSGTLGVLVKAPIDPANRIFLLSCSHVIANGGQFGVAFSDLDDKRKVVQQPVSVPCDPKVDRIGLLQDGFSVFLDQSEGTTDSDLALALLDPDVAASTSNIQPVINNSLSSFATEDPSDWNTGPGIDVQLLGAQNPGATGHILLYNGDNAEIIDFDDLGKVRMTGLVRYSCSNCDKGDSGAPVIDQQNRLLGIHVASTMSGPKIGLFCPVGPYLQQKGLVLA